LDGSRKATHLALP